jgi:ABC-type transport system involved in multi-copper enzyme maturation permease subunit
MPRTPPAPHTTERKWWAALLLLLVLPVGLQTFGAGGLCWALPAAALAVALAFAAWRCRGPILGPLWYYEAVRLARRGHVSLLRAAYALLLLAGLGVAYADRFWRGDWLSSLFAGGASLEPNALAGLGTTFLRALVAAQTAALYLLTPVYVTAAVAEEKEGRTLEVLLSTPLSDREVILGKLLGRLLHVGGILLTGVPLLCLLPWWGGVDGGLVLAVSAATALTLLSVGAVSVFTAVCSETRFGALVMTYAILAASFVCGLSLLPFTTPITFLAVLEGGMDAPRWLQAGSGAALLGFYAFVNGLAAVVFLTLAVGRLRRSPLTPDAQLSLAAPPLPPATELDRKMAEALAMIGAADQGRVLAPAPPVGDRPLLWKELYFGSHPGAVEARGLLFVTALGSTSATLLLLLVLGIAWLVVPPDPDLRRDLRLAEGFNRVLCFLIVPHLAICCLGSAFRAAVGVSRERERHTWDSLLALPVDRRDLLRAKWLGALLGGRLFLLPLALALAAALLTGLLWPPALVLLVLAEAIHVAFFTSLGLWLSLSCRSTLRACLWTGAAVLGVCCGPWLALAFSQTLAAERGVALWLRSLLEDGVNPVGAWWLLGFSWSEPAEGGFTVRLTAAVLGLGGYAGTAWLLWRSACRRLARAGGASPQAAAAAYH